MPSDLDVVGRVPDHARIRRAILSRAREEMIRPNITEEEWIDLQEAFEEEEREEPIIDIAADQDPRMLRETALTNNCPMGNDTFLDCNDCIMGDACHFVDGKCVLR